MKQWKGLFKKEWLMMKEWFFMSVGGALFAIVFLPYGVALVFPSLGVSEITIGIGMLWIILGLVLPTIMILFSLGVEAQRWDIWIHSTTSIYQLLGVKMVFALLIGVSNLGVGTLATFIRLYFSSSIEGLTIVTSVQYVLLIIVGSFMASLMLLCFGVLFGALFQVSKSVTRGFTWPLIVFLTIMAGWLMEKITHSSVYEQVGKLGPIINFQNDSVMIREGGFRIDIGAFEVQTGEVLIDFVFAIFFFLIAAFLIERKVRL